MNILKINNDVTLEVTNYNKTTNVMGNGSIDSNAYCSGYIADANDVLNLIGYPITSISIYHNDSLIYNLITTDARISYVNEYLEQDKMGININFILSGSISEEI